MDLKSVPLVSELWVSDRGGGPAHLTQFSLTGIGAYYPPISTEEAADKALTYAIDRGLTLWDCADIYGDGKLSSPDDSPFLPTFTAQLRLLSVDGLQRIPPVVRRSSSAPSLEDITFPAT